MSKSRGQRFILTAMVVIIGLAVITLYAKTGSTTSDGSPDEVRMAVDPTVLPPVLPPGQEQPQPAPEAAEEIVEAVEPEPAPQPEAPKAKPKAESKPKPKPEPQPAGKGAVTNIAIDSTDNEFILTVTCSRPVGDTTYMNLDNPKRLVIDLREPWTLKAGNVIRAASGAVKHVVVGAHPDRLRLVIHFRTPPKGRLAPQFVRTGNKLIVSVAMP